MIKTALFLLLLVPVISFSQCVKCQSFTEAEKNPAKVVSIQINPFLTDITLDRIPENINIYVNLKELYLTDHGLTSVPKEIGDMKNLRRLSLAGNKLETLPEEIFQLKELEELILFSNSFSDAYKTELEKKVNDNMPKTKLLID